MSQIYLEKNEVQIFEVFAVSKNVVCLSHLLHVFANIDANSVDPYQTAPTGAV